MSKKKPPPSLVMPLVIEVKNKSNRLSALELCDDQSERQELEKFFTTKEGIAELQASDFDHLDDLGAGNAGVVSKVLHRPTGIKMAKKLIHLEVKQQIRNAIHRELQVLHDCNSPHIVGFYGSFVNEGEIGIALEYMDGGSLDQIMKHAGRIPEPIIGKVTSTVLRGLHYLRVQHNIMHRDIKPSNVLVDTEGHIKICDFGVSAQLIDSMTNSFVGTRSYMSPERLHGENYNVLSDIWSLGLSLVEMAIGKYPIPSPKKDELLEIFGADPITEHAEAAAKGLQLTAIKQVKAMAIFELLECIVEDDPPKLPAHAFSPDFIEFVDICLQKEPSKRKDLVTLKQHPFVLTADDAKTDVGNYVRNVLKNKPT